MQNINTVVVTADWRPDERICIFPCRSLFLANPTVHVKLAMTVQLAAAAGGGWEWNFPPHTLAAAAVDGHVLHGATSDMYIPCFQ